jgi:cell division cycle 20-like protein 1 (cofactor of APC complex)
MAKNKRDRFVNLVPEEHVDIIRAKLKGSFDAEEPTDYEEHLAYALFGVTYSNIRDASILNYKPKTTPPKAVIPPYKLTCETVLDCPDLVDNYYFNPLCWGYPLIYIGIDAQLYFHHPTLKINGQIPSDSSSTITSLAAGATYVARADEGRTFQIIDTQTANTVNTKKTRCVFSQMISDGEQFYLSSMGSQIVAHYDPRNNRFPFSLHLPVAPIGIAYNPLSQTLGISSAESIQLFDIRNLGTEARRQSILEFKEHKSPSKALTFFGRNKIATGGGNDDHFIKTWNTQTGEVYREIDTGGQVCNIHWLDANGIVATSGYNANNVSIYRQKGSGLSLDAQTELSDRVLFSAQNPADTTQIVTGSVNEELRLWSIWSPHKPVQKQVSYCSDLLSLPQIR